MKKEKSAICNIAIICIISGIFSGIIVDIFFYILFPSAWLFFIIPAVMGFSIDKFSRIPKSELEDDESFEKLSKRTGLLCAGMVLLAILVAIVPIIVLVMRFDPIYLLSDIIFYLICGVSVYWGYNRGVRAVTDAYYDSFE
ncbi:MAG: hypothetical protein PUD39_04685 [Bacteroidales bacterium]|nr:hypothetical protein [Bacteroidales bacterium]